MKKNWIIGLLGILCVGCGDHSESRKVTIYTSWDFPHSQPILERFEQKTGIRVEAVYDTEAAKTTGLVNRLIAEKDAPYADVFWNSEIVRTIILKQRGVLAPYASKYAKQIPPQFRDSEGYWAGFAARSRVILYNTEQVTEPPTRVEDFLEQPWQGRAAIANPLFGTTATEVATWFDSWGKAETKDYLLALKKNAIMIVPGNGAARDMVAAGEAAVCFTDTDDAWGAIANDRPVAMRFADQGEGEAGALFIPNTVALIRGAPHPEEAKQLIDFLLSPEVEEMLAYSEAAQIPLKPGVRMPEHVAAWAQKRFRTVDFEQAVASMDEAMEWVQDHFLE